MAIDFHSPLLSVFKPEMLTRFSSTGISRVESRWLMKIPAHSHRGLLFFHFTGLKAEPFKGIPHIHAVECVSESTGWDLVGMTLYTPYDNQVVAYISAKDRQCFSSSGAFSSCVLDLDTARVAKLVTLAVDLRDRESRTFGCNVSRFQAGHTHLTSWVVRVPSKRA